MKTSDIVDLPEDLDPEELRSIYRDPDPGRAAAIGSSVKDQDAWDRVRKYAYARYWQHRINARIPMTASDVDELSRFAGLAFMTNVAHGIIGDAAKANLLSEDQVEILGARELNDYATRALAARRLLLARRSIDDELMRGLLSRRAAWALHEILAGPCDEKAFGALERAAGDPSLSRVERHRLREALRLKRRDEKER
jgi:hypothetical protein